jgi:hypothetical protein
MEKTFSERVLDVLSSVGIKFSTKEEVENTEVTVTPELETEVTATVETVAEDATTEEFSAEESQEAIAQAVEKFEEEREELVKEFSTKEADFTHALAELGEKVKSKVKSLQAELEAKQVELDALSVKPTTVEGSQDPSITGEEVKLSESQKALLDFFKDIKG